MIFQLKFYYLILALLLLGCKKNIITINPSEVIISARLLSFENLNDTEKLNLKYSKCCCYPNNWNQGVDCIDKEESYYVEAKINYNLLAELSESKTF